MRFASFAEGEEHVTLDETIEHENTMDLSDDDLSDETIDESVNLDEHFQRINKSKLVNGALKGNSFSSRVASSTPNGAIRRQQRSTVISRLAQSKNNFEISDDE